jgi:hypothetical protein
MVPLVMTSVHTLLDLCHSTVVKSILFLPGGRQCQTQTGAKPNEHISDIAIKDRSCQTGLAI